MCVVKPCTGSERVSCRLNRWKTTYYVWLFLEEPSSETSGELHIERPSSSLKVLLRCRVTYWVFVSRCNLFANCCNLHQKTWCIIRQYTSRNLFVFIYSVIRTGISETNLPNICLFVTRRLYYVPGFSVISFVVTDIEWRGRNVLNIRFNFTGGSLFCLP